MIKTEKENGPHLGCIGQKKLLESESKRNYLHDPCNHGGTVPSEQEIPEIKSTKKFEIQTNFVNY